MRDRAVRLIAEEDPYAALLISMHTYNLLSEHADRSTIAPDQLPLLDEFLDRQREFQKTLQLRIAAEPRFTAEQTSEETVLDHFRLLQATDNLSLLTCVDFRQPSHLLHPFRCGAAGMRELKCVRPVARVRARSLPVCGARADIRIPGPSCYRKSVCLAYGTTARICVHAN